MSIEGTLMVVKTSQILSSSSLREPGDSYVSRRSFFHQVAGGIYGTALTFLLNGDLYAGARSPDQESAGLGFDLKPRPPHFTPKARSVIHLFMNGGPSQMDLFDPKPMLDKQHGKQHYQK